VLDVSPSGRSEAAEQDESDAFRAMLLARSLAFEPGDELELPKVARAFVEQDGKYRGMDEEMASTILRATALNHLSGEYSPQVFEGDMLFFTALRERAGTPSFAPEWSPYATGFITEYEIDCEHVDMMDEEPLGRIAGVLARYLDGAGVRREGER